MSRMPSAYVHPLGTPLYWRDEQSGELGLAIDAYLLNRHAGATITDGQITLLRDYLEYWVNAPCWRSEGIEKEMKDLRKSVRELDSATEIDEWIHKALEIGMDPL